MNFCSINHLLGKNRSSFFPFPTSIFPIKALFHRVNDDRVLQSDRRTPKKGDGKDVKCILFGRTS